MAWIVSRGALGPIRNSPHVISMLRARTTIAAIVKRPAGNNIQSAGSLPASCAKLGLALKSEKIDGDRIDRIVAETMVKPTTKIKRPQKA